MSKDDLQEYFNSIFHPDNEVSEGEKNIILKLIEITIKFRDELIRNTGETLTVEETRMALNIYMEAVNTGRIPANLEKKTANLIRQWFKEISGQTF